MTNEELAVLIQAGEWERLGELWAQVERFVSMKAGRRARQLGGYGGVTEEDLYQSGFLAVVVAAETFREDAGVKFLTWLDFPLKTAFAEAAGYRTDKRNSLNYATGIDAPIPGTDSLTVADTMEDQGAAQDFEEVEHREWLEQLRQALGDALAKLPPEQAELRKRYFENMTQEDAAVALGVDKNTGRAYEARAMRTLRDRRTNQRLREFVEDRTPYYSGTGLGAFQRGGSQPERLAILREEKTKWFLEGLQSE